MKLIVLAVSLVIFISCGEQKGKDQAEKTNQKTEIQKEAGSTSDQKTLEKTVESTVVEKVKKPVKGVMSREEAEILDMKISAYEQNAEDLISWAVVAGEVRNVDEANEVMIEYMEVQKHFNDKTKEIEAFSIKTLGESHKYSPEYEVALQDYLSDPQRIQRTKNTVNATMKLINQYGHDPTFNETMKKLGEMNKYKMKESSTEDDTK